MSSSWPDLLAFYGPVQPILSTAEKIPHSHSFGPYKKVYGSYETSLTHSILYFRFGLWQKHMTAGGVSAPSANLTTSTFMRGAMQQVVMSIFYMRDAMQQVVMSLLFMKGALQQVVMSV